MSPMKQQEIEKKLGRPIGPQNAWGFLENPKWEQQQRMAVAQQKELDRQTAIYMQQLAEKAAAQKAQQAELAKLREDIDSLSPAQKAKITVLQQQWDTIYPDTGCQSAQTLVTVAGGTGGNYRSRTEISKDAWVEERATNGVKEVIAAQLPSQLSQMLENQATKRGYNLQMNMTSPFVYWLHRYVFYDNYRPSNIVCGLNSMYVRGNQDIILTAIDTFLSTQNK